MLYLFIIQSMILPPVGHICFYNSSALNPNNLSSCSRIKGYDKGIILDRAINSIEAQWRVQQPTTFTSGIALTGPHGYLKASYQWVMRFFQSIAERDASLNSDTAKMMSAVSSAYRH